MKTIKIGHLMLFCIAFASCDGANYRERRQYPNIQRGLSGNGWYSGYDQQIIDWQPQSTIGLLPQENDQRNIIIPNGIVGQSPGYRPGITGSLGPVNNSNRWNGFGVGKGAAGRGQSSWGVKGKSVY